MRVIVALWLFCIFQTICGDEHLDADAGERSSTKDSVAIANDDISADSSVTVEVLREAIDSKIEGKSGDQSDETRAERSTNSGLGLYTTAEFKTGDAIGIEDASAKFSEDKVKETRSATDDDSEEKNAERDAHLPEKNAEADFLADLDDLELEKSASPVAETVEVTNEQVIRSPEHDLQTAVDVPKLNIDESSATRRANHPHVLDFKGRTGKHEELDSEAKSAEADSDIRFAHHLGAFGSHRSQINPLNRLIFKSTPSTPNYNFPNQVNSLPIQKITMPERNHFDTSRELLYNNPKFLLNSSRERGNAYPYQPAPTVQPFSPFHSVTPGLSNYDYIFGKLAEATDHPLYNPGFQQYTNNVGLLNKPLVTPYGLQGFSRYNK